MLAPARSPAIFSQLPNALLFANLPCDLCDARNQTHFARELCLDATGTRRRRGPPSTPSNAQSPRVPVCKERSCPVARQGLFLVAASSTAAGRSLRSLVYFSCRRQQHRCRPVPALTGLFFSA